MYCRPLIIPRLIFGILLTGSLFYGAVPALRPTVSAQICPVSKQRNLSFTAVNNEGRLIENLRKEDLTLTVDKAPMEILTLEQKADQRLAVAILIDISLSQERVLDGTKFTAQKFVESVLTGEGDRAMLVSFSGTIYVDQELTDNLGKMRTAIGRLEVTIPAGYIGGGVVAGRFPPKNTQFIGSTAIWDAIQATVEKLTQAAPNSSRVIVLLTDGADTSSNMKMRDALRQAAASDVKIFSIGIGDERIFTVDRGSLRKVSDETGGFAFFPKKVPDLESIFRQIGQEISSQYLITYCTAEQKPGKSPRKVEVQFKDPTLRRSKARLSYRRYV